MIEELKGQIREYTKNMNIYHYLKENTSKAINNAKKIEKYHINLGQALDNEKCIPYTGVHKIVEELIKRNEK